jgi:hypothetical protein
MGADRMLIRVGACFLAKVKRMVSACSGDLSRSILGLERLQETIPMQGDYSNRLYRSRRPRT